MNAYLKTIVVQQIKEQFTKEIDFYEPHLGMSEAEWIRWRKNDVELGIHATEKIRRLFSDYEWMIAEKVVRNAHFIPEIQMNPVREYKQMKFAIARQWIQSGIGETQWIRRETSTGEKGSQELETVILRVEVDYQFWSYKDRLEFRLTQYPHKQLNWSKPELLDWFDRKIEEHSSEEARETE